jgi:hypothetical protein
MYFCVLWHNIPIKIFATSLLKFLYYTQLYTHTLTHTYTYTHTYTHTHTRTRVRLLLTSDQLLRETFILPYTTYIKEENPCSQQDSNPRPQQSRTMSELHLRRHDHRDRLCICLGAFQNTSKLIWDVMLCIFI